jgi:hypothetical protein
MKNKSNLFSFSISSEKKYNLSQVKADKILIKKVKSNNNNYQDLYLPIKIETKFQDGSGVSYFFHPVSSFSVQAIQAITDLPINFAINYCKRTTLELINDREHANLTIYFEVIPPFEVEIYVSEQIGGVTFSLPPHSQKKLSNRFHKVHLTDKIYTSHENLSNFQLFIGAPYEKLISALTGLDENQLRMCDFKIINPLTNKLIFSTVKV